MALGARRTDRLATLADELRTRGAEVVTVGMDVRVAEDVTRLVDTAVEAFGRLDVLVGNAGISSLGPLADGQVTEWDAMIDVNLRGVLHGIAAAPPFSDIRARVTS